MKSFALGSDLLVFPMNSGGFCASSQGAVSEVCLSDNRIGPTISCGLASAKAAKTLEFRSEFEGSENQLRNGGGSKPFLAGSRFGNIQARLWPRK